MNNEEQVNIEVPLDLHAAMKSAAALKNIPLKEAFIEAAEKWLDQGKVRGIEPPSLRSAGFRDQWPTIQPAPSAWSEWLDSNQRRLAPKASGRPLPDTRDDWWTCTDLNRDLTGCRPAALPLSYKPTVCAARPLAAMVMRVLW